LRIFVRILLAFWLVMFTGLALVMFVPSWTPKIPEERPQALPLTAFQLCARRAIDAYQRNGPDGLGEMAPSCYGGRLLRAGTAPTTDLAGRKVSQEEVELLKRARHGGDELVRALPDRTLVALYLDSGSVNSYVFLVTLPMRRHDILILSLTRLERLVILSGLFSLVVTAYFVRPITRLRDVAESFGRGDLKARVRPPLSKRKDEVGDLGRVFNQMAARIENLVARYKNFLAHASHEIGSPLTRLNIALALAKRKAPPGMQPELDRIDQEANRLNSLVQELLLLARLESGNEISRDSVQFDVASIVDESCGDAAFEAQQLRKSVVVVRRESFQVLGYPDLLRRALDNVFRNGLRFAQKEGGVQVSYFVTGNPATGVIQIQDDGPGVPLGREESIFEPFVTLPAGNSSESSGGSGLGLAIARQAVIANGGKVFAQTLSGNGLTVAIELPVARA
jgi:two-component system, OmpR family, sensor histidine kinase CpxA